MNSQWDGLNLLPFARARGWALNRGRRAMMIADVDAAQELVQLQRAAKKSRRLPRRGLVGIGLFVAVTVALNSPPAMADSESGGVWQFHADDRSAIADNFSCVPGPGDLATCTEVSVSADILVLTAPQSTFSSVNVNQQVFTVSLDGEVNVISGWTGHADGGAITFGRNLSSATLSATVIGLVDHVTKSVTANWTATGPMDVLTSRWNLQIPGCKQVSSDTKQFRLATADVTIDGVAITGESGSYAEIEHRSGQWMYRGPSGSSYC